MPADDIDKGIPTTGLLASVLVNKYADHLPLYRQEQIFARAGLAIPRSTLGAWVGMCGVQLQPLVDALHQEILQQGVLHADETIKEKIRSISSLDNPDRESSCRLADWRRSAGAPRHRTVSRTTTPASSRLRGSAGIRNYALQSIMQSIVTNLVHPPLTPVKAGQKFAKNTVQHGRERLKATILRFVQSVEEDFQNILIIFKLKMLRISIFLPDKSVDDLFPFFD